MLNFLFKSPNEPELSEEDEPILVEFPLGNKLNDLDEAILNGLQSMFVFCMIKLLINCAEEEEDWNDIWLLLTGDEAEDNWDVGEGGVALRLGKNKPANALDDVLMLSDLDVCGKRFISCSFNE